MPIHFGLKVLDGKFGLKLTRDKYAIINKKNSLCKFNSIKYEDDEGKFYTDEWCEEHRKDCLQNYDLHMEYFSLLDHTKFNKEIESFLKKNNMFISVTDLNLYNGKPGYYIMVLDEYCQLYVGTTQDIQRRIRSHWSKNKPFDRLLFPMGAVNTSIMSIDSFRALDTTRIYVYETENTFNDEDYYINEFSPEFMCNRLAGGKITGGLIQAIEMMKSRKLK